VASWWSETGKTETALAFLETGAELVSDKWTILSPARGIATFPIGVGVRSWTLSYLPRLRSALPGHARRRMLAAWPAGVVRRTLPARAPGGSAPALAADALARVVGLAERMALRPSEVSAAYGHDEPRRQAALGTVVFLTTTPGDRIIAEPAEPAWMTHRLVAAAAFERRRLFELYDRWRYVDPTAPADLRGETMRREAELLEPALAEATLFRVAAPFPVDPRRVADAIAGVR
jgi:hypothetical protein